MAYCYVGDVVRKRMILARNPSILSTNGGDEFGKLNVHTSPISLRADIAVLRRSVVVTAAIFSDFLIAFIILRRKKSFNIAAISGSGGVRHRPQHGSVFMPLWSLSSSNTSLPLTLSIFCHCYFQQHCSRKYSKKVILFEDK
ncbi:hypothetical protein Y032_0052g2214 [Ancylostoma ceylanicum]|uniref:Uncharacterized protein n=1 Tax=Ancylostoma ceylanicum TaxID=53326 RepID=A0A016U8D0_9BILA|nr:hypothetical protein Y032_0052g2214 [Ancylostoma ceylanicum]